MVGVDIKANPRLSILEQLILFFTIRQGLYETDDEHSERFNYWLQNLILEGRKNIIRSLKNMDKVGDKATPEEVKTEEEKFKSILFLLRADESRYGQLFEDMRK